MQSESATPSSLAILVVDGNAGEEEEKRTRRSVAGEEETAQGIQLCRASVILC